jgi:hypothetical protein
MSESSTDWSNLSSQNERVVGVPAPATAPAGDAREAADSQLDPPSGKGRRRRASRAAVVTAAMVAAVGCAVAVPLSASAAHVAPAAAPSWRLIRTVHGSGGPNFTAVTASSKLSAWAFETFAATSAKPVAWRLTGSAWTKASFAGRTGERVTAAGSSSPGDAWATTFNGSRSRALHWNGSSWAATGSFRTDIDAVTVISSTDVWAFASPFFPGHGGAWHYNGHSWSPVASGHGLTAGSALSRRSVWSVGGTSVAHWNGHVWSRTSVSSLLPADTTLSHSSLVGIYARSRSSVWAVGTGGRQDEGGPAVLLHYNGHAWSKVTQRSSGDPAQVIPDGSGGLWIPVPSAGGIPFQMLRYSGGHLLPVSMPVSGRKLNVLAVAAIPHSVSALGVGFTHRRDNLGRGVVAAVLEYKR